LTLALFCKFVVAAAQCLPALGDDDEEQELDEVQASPSLQVAANAQERAVFRLMRYVTARWKTTR
jgi:hypothetical protein